MKIDPIQLMCTCIGDFSHLHSNKSHFPTSTLTKAISLCWVNLNQSKNTIPYSLYSIYLCQLYSLVSLYQVLDRVKPFASINGWKNIRPK